MFYPCFPDLISSVMQSYLFPPERPSRALDMSNKHSGTCCNEYFCTLLHLGHGTCHQELGAVLSKDWLVEYIYKYVFEVKLGHPLNAWAGRPKTLQKTGIDFNVLESQ